MRRARVYLPLSGADLDALTGPERSLAPAIGYAVTQRLERAHPGADEEALEYAAFSAAVAEAARRLGGSPARRLVGAADVDRDTLTDAGDPQDVGRIHLNAPVPLGALASLHIDEQPGSDDELQWYDITELQSLRALLG